MWVLLSGGLRRWIVLTVAVPVAARLLGSAGQRLEARRGASRLSRGLQGAGRLVSTRARDEPTGSRRPSRRRAR